MMKHGSLFSGIGGFDLAAQWMGWENVFQVEWDSFCQKVLAKNFPNALRFGDIVEFNKMLQNGEITTDTESRREYRINRNNQEAEGENGLWANESNSNSKSRFSIGHIDIITGGFPCQPFSHAGKRKGTDDSRYLWPEMLTTIRILKPSFVVGENVAGLVSMENGKTLDNILSDLENEGYQVESFIIPACGVGAWHRRDRIWIIGRLNTNCNSGNLEKLRIRGGILGKENIGSEATGFTNGIDGTRDSGQSKSSVGGMVNGLPSELDGYWDRESAGVARVATGIKNRVDRLKGLGNAIVPQVAYQIFKAIEEYASTHENIHEAL